MTAPNIITLLTTHELELAREWIRECLWSELSGYDDVDELTDYEVYRGVVRHYSGGVAEFKSNNKI